MEIDVINNNGNQTVTFTVKHNDLKLTATNHTNYTQNSSSRRRYSKEESCEIKFNKLSLLKIKRHIRPGETVIPELSWLKTSNQLHNMYIEDFMTNFSLYCSQPVEFLTEIKPDFIRLLDDPWCFEHNKFEDTVNYFIESYNKDSNYNLTKEELMLQIETYPKSNIKNDWLNAFHSEISVNELVNSGFLIVPPTMKLS